MAVRFGATIYQIVPFPLLPDDFVFAEALGLDNTWVIDQFRIDGMPQVPLLDAWTTLAALAAGTERIRIGALVTNVAIRNPGILAQSILTVDQISCGRVDAVLGSGYYTAEHAALGIDFLDGAVLDYFLESVFNYPTLAESYKVAALNAHNKLSL